jgi:hypothetical protein
MRRGSASGSHMHNTSCYPGLPIHIVSLDSRASPRIRQKTLIVVRGIEVLLYNVNLFLKFSCSSP